MTETHSSKRIYVLNRKISNYESRRLSSTTRIGILIFAAKAKTKVKSQTKTNHESLSSQHRVTFQCLEWRPDDVGEVVFFVIDWLNFPAIFEFNCFEATLITNQSQLCRWYSEFIQILWIYPHEANPFSDGKRLSSNNNTNLHLPTSSSTVRLV